MFGLCVCIKLKDARVNTIVERRQHNQHETDGEKIVHCTVLHFSVSILLNRTLVILRVNFCLSESSIAT